MLITTAPSNADEEFEHRRRRYAVMMAFRAICVIVAALTYRYSMTVALLCVLGGAVLPWTAVIMANDRPPKSRQRRATYGARSGERALPPGPSDDNVVDGSGAERQEEHE